MHSSYVLVFKQPSEQSLCHILKVLSIFDAIQPQVPVHFYKNKFSSCKHMKPDTVYALTDIVYRIFI